MRGLIIFRVKQSHTPFLYRLHLKERRLCSFETPVTIYQSAPRNIPDDLDLHQHYCKNMKCSCDQRQLLGYVLYTLYLVINVLLSPFRRNVCRQMLCKLHYFGTKINQLKSFEYLGKILNEMDVWCLDLN